MKWLLSVVIILICFSVSRSQLYYEASGQTSVFTLTPGVTTGKTVAGKYVNSKTGRKVIFTAECQRTGIKVTIPEFRNREASLSVFNLAGKRMYHRIINKNTLLDCMISRQFLPGIYYVVFSSDLGMQVKQAIIASHRY